MVARPSGVGRRRWLLRLAHVRARHEDRTHRRLWARRGIGRPGRQSSAGIWGIRERDAALYRNQSGAWTQIRKENEIRRKQVGQSLVPEAVNEDNAGTSDRVDYQSLHRTDRQGGQRN